MVKVAFVGCGGIMEEHYRHLSAMPRLKMAGHCDVIREAAQAAASRFGGEAFADAVEMYDRVKPHAVYVAVPPFAHGVIEEAAAERGIHLFIEKPVAVERSAAKRVASAVRKAKVVTSVGYCFRYCDTVEKARQVLKGKAVSLVSGCCTGPMPSPRWWRRMDQSGGQLVEQTTHLFDLLRYLCGEVSEVYAVSSRGCMHQVEDYDVDDSSVVSLRLKSGASAAITSSCVVRDGGRFGLEVVTPEVVVRVDGHGVTITEAGKTTSYRPGVNRYEEEDRAFIEAVRAGKRGRIRSTYADALKTFLVTAAANDSILSGLPVKP